MTYSILFKPAVEKDLKSLPKTTLLRVIKQIIALQEDPLPHKVVKLKGTDQQYRVRLGDYRIIYEVVPSMERIIIHYVRHRRDVYRSF